MRTAKHWQWFPSEAISWQSVVLPKGRGWREALPFAVEEKCADLVDVLRIVPAPSEQDGQRWVAVLRASVWQAWQAENKAHAAVCPDVLALPWSQTTGITAVLEGDRVRLRWGQWQGAAGDLTQMTALLTLLQGQGTQPIRLYAQHVPAAWLSQWQVNHVLLTNFVPELPSFDLGAGSRRAWFNPSKLNAYRLPLSLSALLVMVWFASSSWSAWQAQHQAQQIRQQTEAQFVAAFPDIKRRVNPLAQAKSELSRRQAAGKEQALSLMSAVQVAQKTVSGLPPVQQMRWQQGRLTLTWPDDINDNLRSRIQLLAPWQFRWISYHQLELYQGVAP